MIKSTALAAGLLIAGLMAPATAAPLGAGARDNPAAGEQLVETVQGYAYRRDCVWINGGWHYGRPGRYVVCRPHRPYGSGWVWHSYGGRHGWYHHGHKRWHHNKW